MTRATRKYGANTWSESALDRVYMVVSENNDDPVTETTVDGWIANFARHSKEFRTTHDSMIAELSAK